MLGYTFCFLIMMFCFFSFPLTRGQTLVGYEVGNECYGETCLTADSLLEYLQTLSTPIVISVKGVFYVGESLVFKSQVTFIGPGEVVYVTKKKNPIPVNITAFSDFTAEGINFQIPVYLYGKKKQQLIEEGVSVDQICPDYKCYGNTLGKFDYYSSQVVINDCSFLSDTPSSMLIFGSNTEKTFFNRVSIKNSLFNFRNYNDVASGVYNPLLTHLSPTVSIEEKTMVNNLLIERTRFIGSKIRCDGYYIKLQEQSNYFYPLLFEVDSVYTNKYYMYPLIQSKELPVEVKELKERSQRMNGECRGFYSQINEISHKNYSFGEQGATNPTSDGKTLCVICKECSSCVDFLNIEGCSAIFNSIDALIEYQSIQQDPYFVDNNLFVVKPLDAVLIQGECKSCNFQSIALTVSSRNTADKSLLYCDTMSSDSVIKFNIASNPVDIPSISIDSLVISDRNIQSDTYTSSMGVLVNFDIASPQQTTCIIINIRNNLFRGLRYPISIRSPHHCSSVSITNNEFANNKLTMKYTNNIHLNNSFLSEHPLTEGLFVFQNNYIQRSGDISILDAYNSRGDLDVNTLSKKKRSSVVQSIREVVNPKITPISLFYEKHYPQKSHLFSFDTSKNPEKTDPIKNIDSKSNSDNKKTVFNAPNSVSNTTIDPGFPLTFKIENNQFNVTDRFFHCSGVNGVSLSFNSIHYEGDTKRVLLSSLCDEIYFTSNIFTGAEKINSALLKLAGLVQIISSNEVNGRFKFVLEAGGYDDSQAVYKKSTGSSLVSNNTLSNGAVFEIPESLQEPINFLEKPPPQNNTVCQTLCPALDQLCWSCIGTQKNFGGLLSCFDRLRPCSLNMTKQTSLNCQSCILKRFTTGELEQIGNRVLFTDNILEGCDLSKVLFKRSSQGQCSKITSDYVFFGYNYIYKTCTNRYSWKQSDIAKWYYPIITHLTDKTSYLNEKGSIQTCSANKHRLDLLNPPKCCVEFSVNTTSPSNILRKKNIMTNTSAATKKTTSERLKRDQISFKNFGKNDDKQKKTTNRKSKFLFSSLKKETQTIHKKNHVKQASKEDRLKSIFEKISIARLEKSKNLKSKL